MFDNGATTRTAGSPTRHEHNDRQSQYFERRVKRTMVPVDSPYIRRHVEEILRFGRIVPGMRALEVGCGMGRYSLFLAQRGVQVEGADLSPVLLDRLRTYDGGRFNVPLYCFDVLQPPPSLLGQFDVVLGFFTLHHLHDLRESMKAMARLLRPGGRVMFLEPNPRNPLYYLQIVFTPGMSWAGEKGILQMRPSMVFRAMEEAGLRAVTMSRFGLLPPFVVNHAWGGRVETRLERLPFLRPFLPFQLFRGELL